MDRALLYTVPSKGYQVRAKQVKCVGSIQLFETPLPSPSREDVSNTLLEAMKEDLGGIANALQKFLSPNEKVRVEELMARIRLDTELTEENDWPQCINAFDADSSNGITDAKGFDSNTQEEILTDLVEPWLGSVKSLKELNTLDILLSNLSQAQQNYLNDAYPTSIEAPDGSRVPVRYSTIRNDQRSSSGDETPRTRRPPMLTAKLQQFFGARETPRVGPSGNTIPLVLSLVSPAGKPLAETSDLPFFWSEVYSSIRSEMRGKYPKHPWPEDPLEAVATRKTKKQLSHSETGTNETKNGGKRKKRNRKKKK